MTNLESRGKPMNYQKFVWIFVALALFLLPGMLTGCGADDEYLGESHKTIGPGALTSFDASYTPSIR